MTGLRERQKAEREMRIMDAALASFRNLGFEATRMDKIAEQAELSIGTLYNYFETKGDILVALVVAVTRDTLVESKSILTNPPQDPIEAISALAEAWIDHAFALMDKSLWRQAFSMMIERPDTPSSRRFAENDQRLRNQAAELIRALQAKGSIDNGVQAEDAALMIFNVVDRSFIAFVVKEEMTRTELSHMLSRQLFLVGHAFSGADDLSREQMGR